MSWIAVGIGAAVGAASGAAIGSKKGGDDVWKDALIGGTIGAVSGGAGGALFGGAGAAAEGAAGAGVGEAALGAGAAEGAAGTGLAEGAIGTGLGEGAISSGQLAGGAAGSSAFGGGAAPTSSLAGTQGFGGGLGNLLTAYGGDSAAATGLGYTTPGVFGAAPEAAAGFGTAAPFEGSAAALPGGEAFGSAAAPEATTGATEGITLKPGESVTDALMRAQASGNTGVTGGSQAGFSGKESAGTASDLLDKYGTKAAFTAGTLGLGALLQQDQKKYGTPQQETYTGPLSQFKYSPGSYTPTYATPNVYRARYAEGGIAALAGGGDPMNPIQNPIYPQSQQEHTNFASSTQYPVSMRSAMASDYDTRTNPSLGTELPMGMARGGVARYEGGGWVDTTHSMHPGGALGDWHGQVYGAIADATGFNPGGVGGALMPGNYEYNKKLAEEEEKKRREAEGNAMARGGIASLGGYSDGGQLLRGPGNGTSDSIPASIAGRQPARLADGEFVVPARIVSELGNGSTDAGARELYKMMDRVQASRGKTVGKGKVAVDAKARKKLPA